MTTLLRTCCVFVGFVLLVPALASAQSLAGVVRDVSGAVLPGVTVEASSPALIRRWFGTSPAAGECSSRRSTA